MFKMPEKMVISLNQNMRLRFFAIFGNIKRAVSREKIGLYFMRVKYF